MKNTKANLLKVLNAQIDTIYAIAMDEKKRNGETPFYKKYIAEMSTLMNVVKLMEDNKYFSTIANIYFGE